MNDLYGTQNYTFIKKLSKISVYQFYGKFIHFHLLICLFVSGLLASFKYHYPLSEIEVMECNKWQTNNNIVAF